MQDSFSWGNQSPVETLRLRLVFLWLTRSPLPKRPYDLCFVNNVDF